LTDRVEGWSTLASDRYKTIRAQRIKIRKLEKKIAQFKGPAKIREETPALEKKKDTADQKIEKENQAYETRDHEINMELEERRRELEILEEDDGEE